MTQHSKPHNNLTQHNIIITFHHITSHTQHNDNTTKHNRIQHNCNVTQHNITHQNTKLPPCCFRVISQCFFSIWTRSIISQPICWEILACFHFIIIQWNSSKLWRHFGNHARDHKLTCNPYGLRLLCLETMKDICVHFVWKK